MEKAKEPRLQTFILVVSAFLLGFANGIGLCKFCWPVWRWVTEGFLP